MTRISIFLSVFDAHVQRAPVAGEVVTIKYRPGQFGSAERDEASTNNERNSMWIRTPEGVDVVAVQIAGLIARRIVCSAKAGDKLALGETYGLIRFGSRLDTYFPEGRRRARRAWSAGDRRRDRAGGAAAMRPRIKPPQISIRILPSAMTVAAICLGLSAVKFALDGRPTEAMALLAGAAILDALDGRAARMLNATSKMGEEIDSLADAVNFGVAPAFIV